jgi:uncharacterized protein with HEPN domain
MRKNSLKREFKDYLLDVNYAIDSIRKFTEGFDFNKFEKDEKTIFAVIRAFEIIGEAVKNIPVKVKNEHKEIPWRIMAGMRDKLAHEYFGVNKKVVWRTAKEDIPELEKKMINLLQELKINRLI